MLVARTPLVVLVVLVALLVSAQAHAGSFYLPERGARALAMGGAQVAGADDMNAQWLNPAGLTRLTKDLHLYIDVGLILTSQSFARAADAEVARKDPTYDGGFPTAHNEGAPFVDPSFGVASNLGTDDFVFALGVYGPYAGTNKWDADGPQRYSLVDLEAVELFGQLSAAWRISDVVSVGVGLQYIFTHIKQQVVISAYPGVFGWAEQRDLDVFAEVDVTDPFTIGANAGVIVTPLDNLEFGFSAQLPALAEATGTIRVRIPDHYYFSDVKTEGDQIEVDLGFPAILRLGIRLFDADRWSVELAGVAELWSIKENLDVRPGTGGIAFTDVPGIGTYNVKPFTIEARNQDVFSVRLGGWFAVGDAVKIRAGTLFETGAPPDETITVLKIDGNKLGVGLGATFAVGNFEIDVAASYLHFFEREVSNSIQTQVNPMYDVDDKPYGDTGPHVVGNGTYTGSNLMFATTVQAAF